MKLFAVVGTPVLHSRSPNIFSSLFESMEYEGLYLRLSTSDAQKALDTAAALKLDGFNVTSPLKTDILSLVDERSAAAETINAVNTVYCAGPRLEGTNTDFVGVVNALTSLGIDLIGRRVAVLGAGGAARAAAYGASRSGASRVTLINRTPERARESATRIGCGHAPLSDLRAVLENSDIFISCIPAGLGTVHPDWLSRDLIVLDADYRNPELGFAAAEQGCTAVSGLDWLVEQAVPAFEKFTGRQAPGEVRSLLKSRLQEPPPVRTNLALTGFMGTGKTSLGLRLAEAMNFDFVDTDELVEKRTGRSIPDIFKTLGEAAFRSLEREVIRSLLPSLSRTVIALGGGSVLDPESRDVIKRSCISLWLWCRPERILQRIEPSSRPLLETPGPLEPLRELLAGRRASYARTADLVIDTSDDNLDGLVRRIRHEMD